MNDRNNLGAFDIFRIIAAILVIAIHTSPLWSVNAAANHFVTGVAARIAVPFFFAMTGYFSDLRTAAGLEKTAAKTAALYVIAITLYLPFNTYAADLKMLLFDGAFFHLWYFPACVFGAAIVYALTKLPKKAAFSAAAALYVIGLFGDSYYRFVSGIPPINAVYSVFFKVFSSTRNGLFFAPVFMLIGTALREHRLGENRFAASVGLTVSMLLLTLESFLLYRFGIAGNMYVFLIPSTIYLFELLASFKVKPHPLLRRSSMWIYVIHPIIIHMLGAAAELFGAENFAGQYSLLRFTLATVISIAAALAITRVTEHLKCRKKLSAIKPEANVANVSR